MFSVSVDNIFLDVFWIAREPERALERAPQRATERARERAGVREIQPESQRER